MFHVYCNSRSRADAEALHLLRERRRHHVLELWLHLGKRALEGGLWLNANAATGHVPEQPGLQLTLRTCAHEVEALGALGPEQHHDALALLAGHGNGYGVLLSTTTMPWGLGHLDTPQIETRAHQLSACPCTLTG